MNTSIKLIRYVFGIAMFVLFSYTQSAYCQYFGRNKPSYKTFKYKVYKTPHFEIYHYLNNDSVLNRLAQLSEQWYNHHQSVLKDTFKTTNPIIFYANHADFQQSTAISGLIDVGTGGATESLKSRVVLPIAPSYAQTSHVLGHELVHAFQYHILLRGDSGSYNNLRNIPLWMIEGMAEYFSVGCIDSHTAMWMRDAIVNDDFPTLAEMTQSYKYFPYRFGQCFWAMVGNTWGDTSIVKIFRKTVKDGYSEALRDVTGLNEHEFSKFWKQTLTDSYRKYLDIALAQPVGKRILFSENAGDINISPSISPDGKLVVFLSEKNMFSFDLYLANAETGQIIRKLASTIGHSNIDAINYVESAGTWSPNGKQFAYTIFANGRNKLLIVNVKNRKIVGEYDIEGVPSFSNPAWSPTDNTIAISGMVEGQTNLYLFDLKTHKTSKLTHDNFAYLQPAWSSDGKFIAFSTDKPIKPTDKIDTKGAMNIGTINVQLGKIELINVFESARNLNPLYSADNKSIIFLSNRDGFRNLYRYSLDSAKVFQLTNYFTGISGITDFSPATCIANQNNKLCYSYYYGGKYSIYSASFADFKSVEVNPNNINFEAATLPKIERKGLNIVDNNLNNNTLRSFMSTDSFSVTKFLPKFKLDYVSNINMGVGVGGRLGSGMAGSAYALFSDIVGQKQVYSMVAINGQIYDYGGQVAFMNTKRKVNWGVSVSHIPYLIGFQGYNAHDSISVPNPNTSQTVNQEVVNYPIFVRRIFEDKLSFFGMHPISVSKRIEIGVSTGWYTFRDEVWNQFYDPSSHNYISSSREKLKAPTGFNEHTFNAAYVFDKSYFGMTGPMQGQRFRIGADKFLGTYNYFEVLIDYRKYFYIKPYTLAIRLLHNGRYGTDAEYELDGDNSQTANNPYGRNYLSIGYDWYIRGYNYTTFYNSSNAPTDTLAMSYNDLFGSRIAVANVEFRIPLSGLKRMAKIKSNFVFADLVFFCDAGIAWTKETTPKPKLTRNYKNERIPVISFGASVRINVMGYMVIGPYYAFPLQFGQFKKPVYGLTFWPGW